MTVLPQKYLNEIKELLGDEFDSYIASFEKEAISSIRINEHKISIEDFKKITPFSLEKIDWIHNGFYISKDEKAGSHPYYDAGLYYIQEASAMTPAEILDIKEGERVLDACAAPGGKTTELLSKLNGKGVLFANDISVSRTYALSKNIQRLGFDNAFVSASDTKDLVKYFPSYFDKILVDAPCSGEGMFRKDSSLINSWQDRDSAYFPPLQKDILESAYKMLKPGGKILYSTCTFAKVEDEEVIEDFLSKHSDIKVIDIPISYDRFAKGLSPNTKKAIRLYPHKLKGEGHFCCLMQKDGELRGNLPVHQISNCPKEIQDFIKDLNLDLKNKHIEVIKDEVYLIPNIDISLKGIRITLSGLHLGTLKNKRFNPSTPLALHLKDYPRILDLKSDDINVLKFLKGETISCESKLKGFVLVRADGFPLGFGKADNGSLKNKLEKGWIKP